MSCCLEGCKIIYPVEDSESKNIQRSKFLKKMWCVGEEYYKIIWVDNVSWPPMYRVLALRRSEGLTLIPPPLELELARQLRKET